MFLLASRISDAGVRLPYAELVPSTPSPGPWSDWLRILASSCHSNSNPVVGVEGRGTALEMPVHEAVPYLFSKAEKLLTHAMHNLCESDWADWLKIPLIGAASQGDFETVSTLLKAGAGGRDRGISAWMIPGGDGRTLLHAAADGGQASVVEALLEAGAGVVVNMVAGGGFSPFHVAAIRGSVPVAMALARAGAAVFRKAPFKQSALHLAAGTGHAAMISALVLDLRLDVEGTDDMDGTALHAAAWHGKAECARVLLHLGAEVNALDRSGRSALLQASRCGGRAGCDVMRELLHAGAEVKISSADGDTPLHMACRYGHVDAVRLLLRHDADENARCDLRKTPEDVARQAEDRFVFSANTAKAIYEALAAAPAGRAWRRRGWLVMLRVRWTELNMERAACEDGAAGDLLFAEEGGLMSSTSTTDVALGEEEEEADFFATLPRMAFGNEKRARFYSLEGDLLDVGGGDDKALFTPECFDTAVQADIFDLTATYEYVIDDEGRFSPACKRRATTAFGRRANSGDDSRGNSFHDLILRTFEMADGPFEIIGSYL